MRAAGLVPATPLHKFCDWMALHRLPQRNTAMTTKTDLPPLPERFDCTNGSAQWCYGCYTMTRDDLGDYVLAEDYDALRNASEALRAEVERLQEIVRPKREDECLTLDHWRMRAYALEENWSRCSRACAVEQTKRERAEARAERMKKALRLIESAKDRGFGIDYARGVAQSILLHDQEE